MTAVKIAPIGNWDVSYVNAFCVLSLKKGVIIMFYEPKNGHSLDYNPFNAIVIPRPIGWISTMSQEGIPNLAPYSFFNAVAYTPPQVMFSSTGNHPFGGLKDAVLDAQTTGEFVVNIATYDLRNQMNASSVPAPRDVDEFLFVGLNKQASNIVKCPRVLESPINLECKYKQSIYIETDDESSPNTVVFGEVVGIHIDEAYLSNDRIDVLKLRPISRLGYLDFSEVTNVFSMDRPTWEPN
ncbi:MAG: NADH-FMN oxidoreductase RutF, flavin reductase (DIM6/NTAB) family [Chloroflexi bacterium]|nr:MAG: NADH-FMN oxidoreductase RutF, flavin reductase (DIM6/NTAB) family [Chloroflexota bacterium]